ncbi:MAG: hypothetical protein OEY21_04675 [Nitrospira sp.]|nr:hypothetical protein [Nitrospira sp.]
MRKDDHERGGEGSNGGPSRTSIEFATPGAETGAAKGAEGAMAAAGPAETAETAQEVAGASSKTAAAEARQTNDSKSAP